MQHALRSSWKCLSASLETDEESLSSAAIAYCAESSPNERWVDGCRGKVSRLHPVSDSQKCLKYAASTHSKHWVSNPNVRVIHEDLVFLFKALIGIPAWWSVLWGCENAFIVMTHDSYNAFGFSVCIFFITDAQYFSKLCKTPNHEGKRHFQWLLGRGKGTMSTLSWKLWAEKRKILNVNDTVPSEKILKMAGRQSGQRQSTKFGAFKTTFSVMVFALSSSLASIASPFFSVSSWSHWQCEGEKEQNQQVLSKLWYFYQQTLFPCSERFKPGESFQCGG